MTEKSDGRKARDAEKKRQAQLAKKAARNPAPVDPLTALARSELEKIAQQEDLEKLSHSAEEEEKAFNGANKELWHDVETTYQASNMSLAALVRAMSDLNDKNVLAFMVNKQQFIDRVEIFKADAKRFKAELEEIHALHAHRLDDNTGPRETLAAMQIVEHYTAWRTRSLSILDRTMMELTAMYDEAGRRLMAAVERKRQEHAAAQATDTAPGETEVAAPVEEESKATAHHGHHTHGHHRPGDARTQVHVTVDEDDPDPHGTFEKVVNAVKANPRGLMSGIVPIDEAGQPVIEASGGQQPVPEIVPIFNQE